MNNGAEADFFQQDAKIDMFNGTHVEDKQKQWTMEDAIGLALLFAEPSPNIFELVRGITGISKHEILHRLDMIKIQSDLKNQV